MEETVTAAAGPPRPWRRLLRAAALWVGAVAALGFLLFVYHYLGPLAAGQPRRPLAPLIEELTGAFVGGLMFFPFRWLVRRLPLNRTSWPRRLPLYLLAMLACGAAATTLMWGLRSLLFPLAGLGSYDYGVMPLRYLMELPLQLIAFTVMAGALHAFGALEAARARELRAARIESSFARTQLRNLRLQLQPHFLFNALHTISAVMYEDPAAADEMLEQLAELLRSSLHTAQSDEVPLAEELALLERYLAIQRARFGERLAVEVEVDDGAEALLVPSLILQPLVENAIRHGNAERLGRGAIRVRARWQGERLVLEVEDDGPGRPAAAGGDGDGRPPGLGLASTAERLLLLYGDAQTFSAGNRAGGGFVVRAAIPAHRAAPAARGDGAAPAAPGDGAAPAASGDRAEPAAREDRSEQTAASPPGARPA
jgi:two-component system LytT family sensor kinase